MPKSEPRYDAGYPLAIELVYAQMSTTGKK